MILALDLGTSCGWAILHNDRTITSGTIDLSPRGEHPGQRFLRFRAWLGAQGEPEAVYYEKVYRHLGTDAAHCYGAFEAVLLMWCAMRNVLPVGLGVAAIKKHATGDARAKKPAMVESARARGHRITDDDEADALAILYLAAEREGQIAFPPPAPRIPTSRPLAAHPF